MGFMGWNHQPVAAIWIWRKIFQPLGWVVVSNIFYFHPYLGKIPILTNIFQRGWNHQLVGNDRRSCVISLVSGIRSLVVTCAKHRSCQNAIKAVGRWWFWCVEEVKSCKLVFLFQMIPQKKYLCDPLIKYKSTYKPYMTHMAFKKSGLTFFR